MIGSTASAQDLVVTLNNEQHAEYKLSDISSIRFVDGKLVVKMQDGTLSEPASLDDVRKLTFSNGTTTGINNVPAQGEKMELSFDGSTITASRLTTPADVAIYAISGKKLFDYKKWEGGSLNVGALPKGIYILKVGKQTLKFQKK